MIKKIILILYLLTLSLLYSYSEDLKTIFIEGNKNITIGTNKFFYYKDLYNSVPKDVVFYYPEKKIQLESYRISKFLVTDSLFTQFLRDTNFELKISEDFPFLASFFRKNKNTKKIFCFSSYYEALCFCQWLSNKTKQNYRFPTNAEWEYACMEENKSFFPYGAPDGKFYSSSSSENTNIMDFDYNQVTEDCSSKGIYTVYGASQFVLDSFFEKKYSDIIDNSINPLVLSNSAIFNSRSGELGYNSNNIPEWGLLNMGITYFSTEDSGSNIAIRLVQDEGTIFNKNSNLPFTFFQKVGVCEDNINVFDMLNKYITTLKKNTEVLILYKSLDEEKYYVLFKTGKEWKCAWITSSNIKLADKFWYEISRDN